MQGVTAQRCIAEAPADAAAPPARLPLEICRASCDLRSYRAPPANPLRAFDAAGGAKDADAAVRATSLLLERHSERLPLDRALCLTLCSEKLGPRYHAAARRLLARVVQEVEPPMLEAKRFADALTHVNHPDYRIPAREGLRDCISQLRRLELRIDFNSLPE